MHQVPGYQTQSLFFSDRQTIEPAPKAHKPADSGVPVGIHARRCSFQEVIVLPIKQAPQNDDPRTNAITSISPAFSRHTGPPWERAC